VTRTISSPARVRNRPGLGRDSLLDVTASRVEESLRRLLHGRCDVRMALLFGSHARGTAGPTSDLDVAVDATGVDLLALGVEISRATGLDVDLVDLRRVTVPLLARIVRESIGVHEAERGLIAQWRAWALADLETDRPWFARMRDAWLARVAERGV
jgi:predicted nucleotidyltransferase